MSPAHQAAATLLGELLDEASRTLAAAGLEQPRREARALLSALLPEGGAALYDRSRPVAPGLLAAIREAAMRRAAREPLARIVGRREFWSLDFGLNAATLVPRPDSETLVEVALAGCPDLRAPLRVLDLGTGSGCLLLALLSERPQAWGLGVDRSEAALGQARTNAAALGLADRSAFLLSDWGSALSGGFDLVVSNPPYIEQSDLAALEPEVAEHDPLLALDGGPDGLAAYRALAAQLDRLLAPGGLAVLEVGEGQAEAVAGLLAAAGLDGATFHADLSGRTRALCVRRKQ